MRQEVHRDEEAVAPIVAEVFLVGLSVLLAAWLYLNVTNLGIDTATTRPILAFGPVRLQDGNASLLVAGVQAAFPLRDFRVNLALDGNYGRAVPLQTSSTFDIGGTRLRVTFTDIGGEGIMSAGDGFHIEGDDRPLPQQAQITFALLWTDGSAVQSLSWFVP